MLRSEVIRLNPFYSHLIPLIRLHIKYKTFSFLNPIVLQGIKRIILRSNFLSTPILINW